MAVLGASTNAGALVIQFTFGSAKNDQWIPRPAGDGLYYFVNRLSGLCLDLPRSATGAQLDQQVYADSARQQFRLNVTATPVAQPQISALLMTGSGLVIAGSNGVPNWPYLVLSSTNLAVPAGNWTINATNTFDSSGNFIFTNPMDADVPQLFYMLRLP